MDTYQIKELRYSISKSLANGKNIDMEGAKMAFLAEIAIQLSELNAQLASGKTDFNVNTREVR